MKDMKQDPIFKSVFAAMQDAEEFGGPVGNDYIDLMLLIADEALNRIAVARKTGHR